MYDSQWITTSLAEVSGGNPSLFLNRGIRWFRQARWWRYQPIRECIFIGYRIIYVVACCCYSFYICFICRSKALLSLCLHVVLTMPTLNKSCLVLCMYGTEGDLRCLHLRVYLLNIYIYICLNIWNINFFQNDMFSYCWYYVDVLV